MMNNSRYDLRVNITVILVIIIFVINSSAQYLLYSNQDVLARFFFHDTLPEFVAKIRWVIAASLLTSAATMVFWGYFGDKYSKKYILIVSCVIWISSCFYIYFTPNITFSQLLIAQIFFGLGFGAVWPICFSLLGDIVKPENRGKVFSVVNLTVGIGLAVGLLVSSAFQAAWQVPFLIISIIGSAFVVLFFIVGTDFKKGAAEHELKKVIEEGAVYTYEIRREHLKNIWKKRSNVYLFLQGIPGMIPWAVVILVGPFFFHHLGFDVGTSVFIVLLAQTVSIVGSIFAGWYGDRLVLKSQRKRMLFVALFILLGLPFFFIAFLLPYPMVGPAAGFGVFWSIPIFPFGFILLNIGSFFAAAAGVNWYAIIEDVNEPETRSTIISFHSLTDRIGNALGPILAAVMGPILAVSGSQGDALIIAVAVLFWIPCAVLWFISMRNIEGDVHEMKTLLKERAKELEQGLKSN